MRTKYVRYPELKNYDVPWCRVHLKRKSDAGEFPQPVRLGPNTIAWPEEEILAWRERKRAERDAEQAARRAVSAAKGDRSLLPTEKTGAGKLSEPSAGTQDRGEAADARPTT